MALKLNPVKKSTFYISVILGVLGIVGELVPSIPVISAYHFWILVIGFALLVAGNTMKGV